MWILVREVKKSSSPGIQVNVVLEMILCASNH